jgi:hypothetical protein
MLLIEIMLIIYEACRRAFTGRPTVVGYATLGLTNHC